MRVPDRLSPCRAARSSCSLPPLVPRPLRRPQSPFTKPDAPYKVSGSVSTSDGRVVSGTLYTTLGKRLSLYDRAGKRFVDFSLSDVSRIDVSVEEEHDEAVWYWKESGSDEKVFTGQSYPWRRYVTTVTFPDGHALTGDLDGLVYLEPSTPSIDSTAPSIDSTDSAASSRLRFLFHKRHKGDPGQKPSDLVYVKSLIVDPH